MAGPQDHEAAGGDRLRASQADREQVIEALKVAFVHGRLTKAELDTRAAQALSARTYADLAALTADIPATPADPPATAPTRRPVPVHRRPLARAAARSGGFLVIAAAAMEMHALLDPGNTPTPYGAWAKGFFLIVLIAVFAALAILVRGVDTYVEDRRSRGQLPPGPGSHTLDGERPETTGHHPLPPDPHADENRTDLRAHKPHSRRRHAPTRERRTPGGAKPAPGTV